MPLTRLNPDPATTYATQLDADHTGPIVLLNIFVMPSGRIDEAIAVWQKAAGIIKQKPGFISTQLHHAVGGANVVVDCAVWESIGALKAGTAAPEFRALIDGFPEGTTNMPCVLRKIAVPNVCVE